MRLVTFGEDRLRTAFGIGVAGNFAGHLEQAGEDRNFAVVPAEPEAPKGIFPYFAPGTDGFLGEFPLSNERIAWSTSGDLQIEPELGVLCAIDYDNAGTVTSLRPEAVAAFNDCSARRPDANKISEKKNWGACSKGVANRWFDISEIEADGETSSLRIACFLRRAGVAHEYGIDSAVPEYSYYGTQLLDWIVDRIREQKGEAGSPLEDVGALINACGRPATTLIGIGATRYTAFGETNFLQPDDESIVVVYDSSRHAEDVVQQAVESGAEDSLDAASVLRQTVS